MKERITSGGAWVTGEKVKVRYVGECDSLSYLGVEERFTSPTLGVGTRQFESDRPDQFYNHRCGYGVSGSIRAFQAQGVGSSPTTRSNLAAEHIRVII